MVNAYARSLASQCAQISAIDAYVPKGVSLVIILLLEGISLCTALATVSTKRWSFELIYTIFYSSSWKDGCAFWRYPAFFSQAYKHDKSIHTWDIWNNRVVSQSGGTPSMQNWVSPFTRASHLQAATCMRLWVLVPWKLANSYKNSPHRRTSFAILTMSSVQNNHFTTWGLPTWSCLCICHN